MDPLGILSPRPTGPVGPALSSAPSASPERSDAARNRERLVATARHIIERDGVAGLTMDGLAAECGVGKGTIFRRFGSRAGLFQALLNDVERDFQASFLSGPPPLGPGAPPVERLVAFGRARIEVLSRQRDLMVAAERPPEERFDVPARQLSELHIATLLRQSHLEADVPVLSFNLHAVLDAILTLPGDGDLEGRVARLADGWEYLVRRIAA
ncbi:MAG: TetR/AcrR family transcriptional regulator [Herbiconiux sp.]|nr:TetR/AcrR family transcriptional regulator [Herbiconiux sp.]